MCLLHIQNYRLDRNLLLTERTNVWSLRQLIEPNGELYVFLESCQYLFQKRMTREKASKNDHRILLDISWK